MHIDIYYSVLLCYGVINDLTDVLIIHSAVKIGCTNDSPGFYPRKVAIDSVNIWILQ